MPWVEPVTMAVRPFRSIFIAVSSRVENGVDLGKFAGAASRVPVRRLLALGRFSTNKRPERLIALMGELGPGWHLDLVGVESDWTAERLGAAIAAAGVGDRTQLHVGIADDRIAELMGGASLFVSASEFEGFGLALVEAMSAGLVPVVHPNAAFAALAERQPAVRLVDFAAAVAAAAAGRGGEAFIALQFERARQNRDRLAAARRATRRFRFGEPQGAFYLFPELEGLTDSRSLALRLVDEAGVGVAPGSAFGKAGEGFVRLCFARSPEDVAEVGRRLAAWLDR